MMRGATQGQEATTVNEWTRLGALDAFGEQVTLVEVGRNKIAVARMKGELYAFSGVCPHAAGPIHRGEVEGTVVTCPLHGWRFDVSDGGRELHDYRPLKVYEIKVEEGVVHIRL
jgi:nitrite reductase/ring-hydroxylating ferredoxin subunit